MEDCEKLQSQTFERELSETNRIKNKIDELKNKIDELEMRIRQLEVNVSKTASVLDELVRIFYLKEREKG